MRGIPKTLGVMLLAVLTTPAFAKIYYSSIDDGASTAGSENSCPAWVLEANDDDCSYNAGNPLELGNTQWVGPVFSAGYYAPGTAPLVYDNSQPMGPVMAPAPELDPGGKTGIPVERGFIRIDDLDSPSPTDDVISGTLQLGAFQRNVAVSAARRNVESIDHIIHRFAQIRVSGATPNGAGGYDYVIARAAKMPAFPALLSGSTTDSGGFADSFPSEVASQSTMDISDFPYWSAAEPGGIGIALLDGDAAALGSFSAATVWGYSCDDGDNPPGPTGCFTNGFNWDAGSRAAYSNILLRISTDGSHNVVSAEAFLVNEADLSPTAAGFDSWTATTLSFTGTATVIPEAYDDLNILQLPTDSISTNVLANDLTGADGVTVAVIGQPSSGTATVPANSTNILYQREGTGESEQVITYEITDVNDLTVKSTAELHIQVTDRVICEDDEATGERDSPVTVDVTANDSGFDLPPITVTLDSSPEEGGTLVNPDRTITYTPPPDTGGVFNIAYRLNDGANSPDTCNLRIQIPALPEAVDDTIGISVDAATSMDVLANDLEISDIPITLAVVDGPMHGTAVANAPGPAPKILYTPEAGYTGPDSFTYQITDTDGDVSNIATVSISIFGPPENDLPTCANDTAEIARNETATVDVLANDTGLNALPVTVQIVDFPEDSGTAVVNPDNTISFTPPTDKGGTFSMLYSAREALNNPVQCILTVTVDDLPVAEDDIFAALNFGEEFLLNLLANDTGLSDRPITIDAPSMSDHGTLTVCNEATPDCPEFTTTPFVRYRYDDTGGYPAVDTFSYSVTDEDGDTSNVATVTISPKNTPTATNDPEFPPLISNPDYRTASGHPITLNVLANDGGLLRTPITVTIETAANGGTAVVNPDSTITYRPREGFTGQVSFSYRITDADGAFDTAQVSLWVLPTPVTDTGSSALDPLLLAILGIGLGMRHRRRTDGPRR